MSKRKYFSTEFYSGRNILLTNGRIVFHVLALYG